MKHFIKVFFKGICVISCTVTFLFFCLMTFLYFVTDGSFENRRVTSFPVKFYISSELIKVPMYGNRGEALYSTDDELMYDGFHMKEYRSNTLPSNIHEEYKYYFKKQKCSRGKKKDKSIIYQCGNNRFKVLAYKSENFTEVAIFQDIKRN